MIANDVSDVEIGFGTVRDQLLELDAAFPGGRYRPSPALERIS